MEQSRIHQSDPGQAIHTLPEVVKTGKDRQRAMAIAQQIVFAHTISDPHQSWGYEGPLEGTETTLCWWPLIF